MNTFEYNYWSLYFDFLKTFEEIKLGRFPISLYFDFYQLTIAHSKFKEMLLDESLSNSFQYKINDELPLQTQFDEYLLKWSTKKSNKKFQNGYAVFYDNHLRIPYQNYLKYNQTFKTVLLKGGMKINKVNYPFKVIYLHEYSEDIEQHILEINNQIKKVLATINNHPIFGKRIFQENLLKEIPKIIYAIISTRNLFNAVPVRTVILGQTAQPESKALALTALELGIPTICLQHGIIALEFGYLPVLTNYLAVYGKYEFEWYKNKGVSEHRIKKIGAPTFDYIFKQQSKVKRRVKKVFNIDLNKKTILIICHHKKFREVDFILSKLTTLKGINIIIKPRGNRVKIKKILNKYPKIINTKNISLYEIFHTTDIVISYESTVVLEAMLAKKTVFVWTSNEASKTNYFEGLDSFFYNDISIISNNVVEYLFDDSLMKKTKEINSEFITYRYSYPLNKSSERLRELINSINE